LIIRTAGEHLQFITQPDHAKLSRRVMEACTALATHPRRAAILNAIGEHDNGWAEPDAAPIVDPASGNPIDFVSAPLTVRHGVWPRAVQRLTHDPWAATLVAQHAITVYERYWPDPEWTPFFTRMASLRDEMLRASGVEPGALPSDYVFVRLGDLISLAFCTGWTDALHFAEWTVSRTDTDVHVSPDPFGGAVIPLEVQARALPPGPYQTDSLLQDAFADASVTTLRGAASGG
jgi:hypothetical protein